MQEQRKDLRKKGWNNRVKEVEILIIVNRESIVSSLSRERESGDMQENIILG